MDTNVTNGTRPASRKHMKKDVLAAYSEETIVKMSDADAVKVIRDLKLKPKMSAANKYKHVHKCSQTGNWKIGYRGTFTHWQLFSPCDHCLVRWQTVRKRNT